jgi:hypothetical protein
LGHQEVELKDWKTLSLTILQMMRILSVIKWPSDREISLDVNHRINLSL